MRLKSWLYSIRCRITLTWRLMKKLFIFRSSATGLSSHTKPQRLGIDWTHHNAVTLRYLPATKCRGPAASIFRTAICLAPAHSPKSFAFFLRPIKCLLQRHLTLGQFLCAQEPCCQETTSTRFSKRAGPTCSWPLQSIRRSSPSPPCTKPCWMPDATKCASLSRKRRMEPTVVICRWDFVKVAGSYKPIWSLSWGIQFLIFRKIFDIFIYVGAYTANDSLRDSIRNM